MKWINQSVPGFADMFQMCLSVNIRIKEWMLTYMCSVYYMIVHQCIICKYWKTEARIYSKMFCFCNQCTTLCSQITHTHKYTHIEVCTVQWLYLIQNSAAEFLLTFFFEYQIWVLNYNIFSLSWYFMILSSRLYVQIISDICTITVFFVSIIYVD